MVQAVYFVTCLAFLAAIFTVIASERQIYREMKNFTYLDCYEIPPFEHRLEVSELAMPYPDSWDGLKGRFHGYQCLKDCNEGKFLYAAITSMVETNETMKMICSCGNTRPYVDQRPPYCHWKCSYPSDLMETWCAYPEHHLVSRVYAMPDVEYPEVAFVGCVDDLLDGPVITERTSWSARFHVFGLWLVKFYAEDCYFDCQWRGHLFAGIHSFWNGKTMVFQCRCGDALPKRQDRVMETFCPWKCTYYNRYPLRWCSYHADKWWTAVYMIVDKDHPRRLATPYPTPVPIEPEDYELTTAPINIDENTTFHRPVAPVMRSSYEPSFSLVAIILIAVAGVLCLVLAILFVVMIKSCRERRKLVKEDPGHSEPSVDIVEIHTDQAHIIVPDNEI